jgi:hypothetical protein
MYKYRKQLIVTQLDKQDDEGIHGFVRRQVHSQDPTVQIAARE